MNPAKKSNAPFHKECFECGKTFTVRGHFYAHKRSHRPKSRWQCPLCGKSFDRKDDIIRVHVPDVHPERMREISNGTIPVISLPPATTGQATLSVYDPEYRSEQGQTVVSENKINHFYEMNIRREKERERNHRLKRVRTLSSSSSESSECDVELKAAIADLTKAASSNPPETPYSPGSTMEDLPIYIPTKIDAIFKEVQPGPRISPIKAPKMSLSPNIKFVQETTKSTASQTSEP